MLAFGPLEKGGRLKRAQEVFLGKGMSTKNRDRKKTFRKKRKTMNIESSSSSSSAKYGRSSFTLLKRCSN